MTIDGGDAPERLAGDAPLPVAEDETEPVRPARTYNVVLISVDTLRFDLGFMGYPRPVSPNIDALAARSTVFERAYATASYTPKSLGPMMIGRYASETFRDREHFTSFYPKNTFVAERVRDTGGRTFAAMCHHYFKWDTGMSQGFELWDTSAIPPGMKDNDRSISADRLTDVALRLLETPDNVLPAADPDSRTPGVPRRFFAWFHYLDPHGQYVPHEGAPDFAAIDAGPLSSQRTLYDQEVWFTDKQIGRLLDYIASQAWGDDTSIVLTADHGEAFGERGFWRHGRELWEPVVRIPLVIYVPRAKPRRIHAKRSHIDLAPTILDLMGISSAEGELRGKSLVGDVFADGEVDERDVYMDMPEGPYNEMRQAIITGPSPGLKLINFGNQHYELYDLGVDPDETKNLAGDERRFRSALSRFRLLRAQLREIEPSR